MIRLVPITLKEAKRFIWQHHRHNEPPVGWLIGVGVEKEGELVGVGILGRPVGRGLQDGFSAEITRCTTNGERNVCSMIYGALSRAAFALGYRRVYTYTLESEPGSSLKAAGFVIDTVLPARDSWATASRPRHDLDLFGNKRRPAEPKIRWLRAAS